MVPVSVGGFVNCILSSLTNICAINECNQMHINRAPESYYKWGYSERWKIYFINVINNYFYFICMYRGHESTTDMKCDALYL